MVSRFGNMLMSSPCMEYLYIQYPLLMHNKNLKHMYLPFGLVVRIPGFHPGGPGSIPGMGNFLVHSPSIICDPA